MKTKTTRAKSETDIRARFAAQLCRRADRSMRMLANYIAAVAVTAATDKMSDTSARMLSEIIGVKFKPGKHNDYELFIKSLDLLFDHIGNAVEDKILATLATVGYMEAKDRRKAKKTGR